MSEIKTTSSALPTGLYATLLRINWDHGRGDVKYVVFNSSTGVGRVCRRVPTSQYGGFLESHKFTVIDKRKVRYLSRTLVFSSTTKKSRK